MMMSGWKNQFQTGTYAFMNIHNMICVLILAHTSLDQLHLTLDYVKGAECVLHQCKVWVGWLLCT